MSDDGVRAFAIGTAVFALALLLALLMPQLAPERSRWLTVTPTGTAIGVIGTGYCVWRRNRTHQGDSGEGDRPTTTLNSASKSEWSTWTVSKTGSGSPNPALVGDHIRVPTAPVIN